MCINLSLVKEHTKFLIINVMQNDNATTPIFKHRSFTKWAQYVFYLQQ